jgi:hypothetical protein
MEEHDESLTPDLIMADYSEELHKLKPRVLEGCEACRACALWRLRATPSASLNKG